MKRLSAILFAVLFVTGYLVAPAVHQAHCADAHAAHDAGRCPVCQMAHTPLQLSAVILAPVDAVCTVDTLVSDALIIPKKAPRTPTQARAPPA